MQASLEHLGALYENLRRLSNHVHGTIGDSQDSTELKCSDWLLLPCPDGMNVPDYVQAMTDELTRAKAELELALGTHEGSY
jgi:hypothetical protein